jgi:hypothetical protein
MIRAPETVARRKEVLRIPLLPTPVEPKRPPMMLMAPWTCEEKNLKLSRFCHIFSVQINIKRRHPMFSGLILALGLSFVGLIVFFLHKEHGPSKKH